MNLASLDLNLVVALRALLEERNVTRAGQRVGLSQPAMSAALSRLRRHFDDDLLARVGGRYELTALGLALLDRTATACDLLERRLRQPGRLRPGRARAASSPCSPPTTRVAVFGAELARTIHSEAPGHPARASRSTPPAVVDNTATLLSTVDGLLHAARHHRRLPRRRPLPGPLGLPRRRRPPRRRRRSSPSTTWPGCPG